MMPRRELRFLWAPLPPGTHSTMGMMVRNLRDAVNCTP